METFEIIKQLAVKFSIKRCCEAFSVYRSRYHYWAKQTRKVNVKQVKERAMIRHIFNESKGSAGARTIAKIATNRGEKLSRYKARKHMKVAGLVSCQQRSHRYKKAEQPHKQFSNELNRAFVISQPNKVWCGDITYVWAGNRWAYLAAVMDLFNRKIIGWSLSCSPNTDLTIQAFKMAFESRNRPADLMFHSDQGSTYTSHAFTDFIRKNGAKQSMSRRGNCWDNAPMERFFRSLKTECVQASGYRAFDEAEKSIRNYIVDYYCEVRPHQYNCGLSPNEKERLYWNEYKCVT